MFQDEVVIGSIKAQANRLRHIISLIEADERWRENRSFYAKEIHDVERGLKMIRRIDFEPIAHVI